jgi:L-rhamnose isomerase
MLFLPELVLHVSRGVRWDSDHVVVLNDDLQALAHEVIRGGYLGRVRIALDYFDATINRIAAWVIGTRSLLRALLVALLEPSKLLRDAESSGDYTSRLALQEEFKLLPAGAVWDYHCLASGVPVGDSWLPEVKSYEVEVLSQR